MSEVGKIQRVPPVTVNVGQACRKCLKAVEEGAMLKTCTGCRRIRYCSAECQKADWKAHKGLCKAFREVEGDPQFYTVLSQYALGDGDIAPYSVDRVNYMAGQMGVKELHLVSARLGRELTIPERNIVCWQPRCMTWCTEPTPLTSCPDCHLSFYCKPDHWQDARRVHTEIPDPDGHNQLTQCALHRQIRLDLLFVNSTGDSEGFQYAPDRTKEKWEPLKDDATWESEVGPVLAESINAATPEAVGKSMALGPMLRCATDGLSMPLTILYALEHLNSDDAWTRKQTLSIHILGATLGKEIINAQLFEEIMHQCPEVKNLQITFCGPELPTAESWLDMETCPRCESSRRKRQQRLYTRTYHDYALRQGSAFEVPDLAVAFNSGCSHEARDSWEGTIKMLVARKIPTVFTSYNREEAEGDARRFIDAGATLNPALGPQRNPWGSQALIKEPHLVSGFYSTNGWLACGFR
ncbi:hypothetical protein FB107DRAFT_287093 [Schizophyllum commune]